MEIRWSLGPVFKYEWIAATRRWQLYAIRSLFVSAILAAIVLIWFSNRPDAGTVTAQRLAMLGTMIYVTMVFVQVSMVLLVAPASTAGAVCLDKARGTLDHILATELSNSEVVLGKLGVRLIPMIGIVASLLPAMILTSLIGGVDPDALIGSFLVTLGTAGFACSLALTLSVWGNKAHEVLFTTYFLLIGWVLAAPLGFVAFVLFGSRSLANRWWFILKFTNPYYLTLAPYNEPGVVGYWTCLAYLVGCVMLSGLMVAIATLRIRTVCQNQAGRVATTREGKERSRPARWRVWARGPRINLPRPTLDGNPILWREWHRNRPSRWMRIVWGFYVALGLLLTGLMVVVAFQSMNGVGEFAVIVTTFQVNLGLLLLNVLAATSLSEERMRGSLDVLMTTPITTFQILAGKWWGAWRILPKLMFLPGLVAFLVALASYQWGRWFLFLILISGYGATAISSGLACATWISRLGRAIAISIGVCVVFNFAILGIIVVTASASADASPTLFCSLAGSLSGTFMATLFLSGEGLGLKEQSYLTPLLAFWCVAQYLIAAGLFLATWASFDRCMGRSSSPRREARRARRERTVSRPARPQLAEFSASEECLP